MDRWGDRSMKVSHVGGKVRGKEKEWEKEENTGNEVRNGGIKRMEHVQVSGGIRLRKRERR